jgi:hypothetical protein
MLLARGKFLTIWYDVWTIPVTTGTIIVFKGSLYWVYTIVSLSFVTSSELNAGCQEEISGIFASKLKDTGRQRYVNWSADSVFPPFAASTISVLPCLFVFVYSWLGGKFQKMRRGSLVFLQSLNMFHLLNKDGSPCLIEQVIEQDGHPGPLPLS